MSRSILSFALAFCVLATAAPAAAQTVASELDTLRRQSEELDSGLAQVRRELMGLRVRGMDEMGAARLVLTYEDRYVALAPISAAFSLDGSRLFTSTDRAQIENGAIYAGAIPSGPHVLTLELHYRGDVLYTTGYQIAITSSYTFTTPLDRTTHLRVIGHDTNVFAPPPDRWTVDYATETDPAE